MKKLYFCCLNLDVNEGGMARNMAFYNKAKQHSQVINVFKKSTILRLLTIMYYIPYLLIIKNRNIFIHFGALQFLFPSSILSKDISQFFLKIMLHRFTKKNKVCFEVNDLPYEQSIDLGLDVKIQNKIYQQILFSCPCDFLFASKLMRDYAVENYHINKTNTSIIVNGAPKLSNKKIEISLPEGNQIKYIYSGTLNKGRGIEELIEAFTNQSNAILILIGTNGEWLKNKPEMPDNVYYLGSFLEDVAHIIVSKCDVGIVHYDENKLYYNICFPTKSSFYISAGIAVLCTPLKEMVLDFEGIFMFSKLSQFNYFISNTTVDEIKCCKEKIINIKELYLWENLLKNLN